MAILALEPDVAKGSMIRHVVCDMVRADLKLVRSMSDLLKALSDTPDLILLPALLSPGDETELLTHLGTLQNSGHLEILVTPFAFASEDATPVANPRGWRRWLKKSEPGPEVPACDPRAFSDQLAWSLQRVHEARKDMDMVDAPESAAATNVADATGADRRQHQRFPVGELQGLRTARIKHGPQVRLVDYSAGGALVASDAPLQPESEAVLELIGEGRHSAIPVRVVRCHASIVENRLIYWGACAFLQPQDVADLLPRSTTVDMATPAVVPSDRFDDTVKEIVNRYVAFAGGDAALQGSRRSSHITELVASLRGLSRSRPGDPVAHAMNELVAIGVAALELGDAPANPYTLIEKHLRVALPWLTARFAATPTPVRVDRECLYFKLPTPGNAGLSVLNVELPQGSLLESWQFRLLKASTYVAVLLQPVSTGEAAGLAAGRDRRRHVRMPGRLEGRRVGAIDVAILARDLSESGCFVDSLFDEDKGRTLALEIQLPDETWFAVKAEVVDNRSGCGFVVRFVEMREELRARLARVVAEHTQSSTEDSLILSSSMVA